MSMFDVKRRLAHGRIIARCTMTKNVYRLHPDIDDVYLCTPTMVINYGPLAEFIQRVKNGLTRARLEAN